MQWARESGYIMSSNWLYDVYCIIHICSGSSSIWNAQIPATLEWSHTSNKIPILLRRQAYYALEYAQKQFYSIPIIFRIDYGFLESWWNHGLLRCHPNSRPSRGSYPSFITIQEMKERLSTQYCDSNDARSFLNTLHRAPGVWMNGEALESGILPSIFSTLEKASHKQRRGIVCIVLRELSIVLSSMPTEVSSCLFQ